MAVSKRFLETHEEFVLRVLESPSVDYCLLSLKVTDRKVLVFREKLPGHSGKYSLGGHYLDKGPEIGRIRITTEFLKDCNIEFFTYDEKPKMFGVKHDADGKALRDKLGSLRCDDIPQYRGKHIFTDPLGRRWFMFADTVPHVSRILSDNQKDVLYFKLTCEKGIENYGGQGWMSLNHIHLYLGEWHIDNAEESSEVIDAKISMNQLGTHPRDESLSKRYTIEETRDRDVAVFAVALGERGYAQEIKYYKLTLHLKDVCKETQAFDIAPLLRSIYYAEFARLPAVFIERNLKIEYNANGPMSACIVRQNVGHRYYNSMAHDVLHWDNVRVRHADLYRYFA